MSQPRPQSQGGGAPASLKFFAISYMRAHGVRKTNLTVLGDHTG